MRFKKRGTSVKIFFKMTLEEPKNNALSFKKYDYMKVIRKKQTSTIISYFKVKSLQIHNQ